MSERAKATPPAGESITALSDHLGRMLQHADRLVAEWQEHADAMRARFEAEARSAGDVLRQSLEAALADAGSPPQLARHVARAQNAAERLGGPSILGAAPPDVQEQLGRLARDLTSLRQELARATAPKEPGRERLLVPLVMAANVLLVALLAIVWLRKPAAPVAPAGEGEPRPVAAPVLADAGVAAGPGPGVDPPEVRVINPCAAIALSGADGERSLNECVDHICGMPDKDKPSLPDNCGMQRESKKGKKTITLSCKFGTPPAPQRVLRVEWTGECPAPPPAAPAPAPAAPAPAAPGKAPAVD